MLRVGNELRNTSIKVIPLVVTDKESKCTDCRSYLIPRAIIENIVLFTTWYKQKSKDIDIKLCKNFGRKKTNEIIAKFASSMGATKIDGLLPAFTKEEEKLMKEALLLLTPEQIDILHSEEKHLILDGPYGSGKSIICRTKAKMIADNLLESELLCYISFDSRSALPNEIERNNPKIKILPHKEEQ